MKVEIAILLKKGVTDPEGEATAKTLRLLGFPVKDAKFIKTFRIEIDESSREKALSLADEMCRKLLANPVIHKYEIRVVE
jgi:phosphoribosylformylglycinamidine synthase